MYIRNIVIFLLFSIVNVSCAQKKSTTHDLSIQINDQAMELLRGKRDTFTQLKSLRLLDSAIKIDKSNFMAYNNKISILLSMKRIDEADSVLDVVNSSVEKYTFIMLQGFIYERAYKDTAKAQQNYRKALSIVDSTYKLEPNNKSAAINRAFLILLVKGKKEGITEYNLLMDKYKNDEFILEMKNQFYDFDRKQYLNSLW